MEKKKIIDAVSELLDKEQQNDRVLMDSFLSLLFWKDYKDGHVKYEDRADIFKQIKEATKIRYHDNEKNVYLHADKIMPFVNKIREQLGLFKLTNKVFGTGVLLERTPEVEKQLILKELEK